MPDYPRSARDLPAFLRRHPRVRITGIDGETNDASFQVIQNGGLWFRYADNSGQGAYLPIRCTLTEAAALAEEGLAFDERGFTLTKFGRDVRVDYLPDQEPSS